MELRHIRYFLAVAEEANFTRAAARVGIGQPPLSQQIRDLEAEIGAQLFRRVPHGAELTEAGRAFLKQVQSLPDQAAAAADQARRAARGETGALRLGMTGSATLNPQVVEAITAFRDTWPQVDLTLVERYSNDLADAVRMGEIDVAFLRREPVADDRLKSLPLADERMIAALPSDDPLLVRPRQGIALTDLRDRLFILPNRASVPTIYSTVMSACAAAGFAPGLGQAAPNFFSAVMLVAARFGVAIVPASMRRLHMGAVAYLDLDDPGLALKLVLVHAASDQSPATRNFIRTASRAAT